MADGASEASVGLVTSTTSGKPAFVEGSIPSNRTFCRQRRRLIAAITKRDVQAKRVRRTRKTVLTSARLTVEQMKQGGFRGRWAMLTLTYRAEANWEARHLSDMLQNVRKYAQRTGFPMVYVWALELTEACRPHYHVLFWLPKGRTLPKPDKQRWWKHGSTRIEWAKKAVGYIAKYASKGIEGEQFQYLPKGARMCGNGGLNRQGRTELRWWKLPVWVRDHWPFICDIARTKGGYVERGTGEFLASPYACDFQGGVLLVFEKGSQQR